MQIDGANSAGGQRHHGVETVSDGRPNDNEIVRSNVRDSMENDGFHNSFRGNSFSKIGSVQSFIAPARHIMKNASVARLSRLASGARCGRTLANEQWCASLLRPAQPSCYLFVLLFSVFE
jgi:hypothetical protein